MSARSLNSVSGLSLIIGGLFGSVGYLIRPSVGGVQFYTHPAYTIYAFLTIVGAIFLLLGLPGMQGYQANKAGKFGFFSFGLFFVGLAVLELGSGTFYAFTPRFLLTMPDTAALFAQEGGFEARMGTPFMIYVLSGFLATNLGAIMYGIATYRARVYPKFAALLIAIGAPAVFLLGAISPVFGDKPLLILFAGLIWCGWFLATRTEPAITPLEQPSAV